MQTYDVTILGGGLAGLTLARQLLLKNPELSIAILERKAFPVPEIAHKVGESTVEIGAHYLSEVVQLKKHLIDDQLPKFGLRFFFRNELQTIAEGTEVGGSEFFPAPSYQVDRGRLENYLAGLVQDMGAKMFSASRVTNMEVTSAESGSPHKVEFENGQPGNVIHSRWLVDATGRQGVLKRHLQLNEDIDHSVNAVWFRVDKEIRIDQWGSDDAWKQRLGQVPRRWLSTNHLLGPGYWVWLIPLASGATSVGIVCDPKLHSLREMNSLEKALDWLREYQPECADQLEDCGDKVCDFKALRHLAKGCKQVFSANRWAITGEAGVFLDPFYSPGSDYIAIGNTMIAKLIHEDMAGQSLEQLAPTLQSVFMSLFQNNLLTYQDQYPLFGNARVMSLKIVWDYALYWAFPALLYFQEQLANPSFVQTLGSGIEQLREMNVNMQQFFRDWHQHEDDADVDQAYLDQRTVAVLYQLNAELKEPLDEAALKARFERNVNLLRDLMHEIQDRVCQHLPEIAPATGTQPPAEPRLGQVFENLNL